MIVDTSALVALATREPGWEQILSALEDSPSNAMSTVSLLELHLVFSSARFARPDLVQGILDRYRIDAIDFTRAHTDLASAAFTRFGRGNHPARLNFGDCASYATARLAAEPLLYVGEDFARTDIESALRSGS